MTWPATGPPATTFVSAAHDRAATATCNGHRRSGCTRRTATARTGLFPAGVDIDRATGTVYVANSGNGHDGTVSVINGATCNAYRHSGCGQKAPKVKVGGVPFALAVDQATDPVYVADLGGHTV